MSAASSNARRTATRYWPWLPDGLAGDARSWRRTALNISVFGGLALLGGFWGSAVAVAELNALYLCVSLIGCVFILLDFRIGVVLLILLMPISRSAAFPHAMLGITGLNPVNLLLLGTLGSCLLHGLSDSSIRRFIPRPLLWLYIVPFLVAGALGSRHVGDIAHGYFLDGSISFDSTAGYVRDLVVKPLFLVVFALLVGAAVAKSEKPEKFLVPTLISIWVMGSMAIVFSGLRISTREVLSQLGSHPNELGRLYAVAYALLLFTWAELKESVLRWALLASMGLVMVALMLTLSRGGFLCFIVVNALFLLWRRNAQTLIFLGLLTAVALFLLPNAVYDRIAQGIQGYGSRLDEISSGRIEGIWLPLLPEILRSPIYGSGLSSILWTETMREGTALGVAQAHNAYLETLLDMGIAGLILVCAYFAHIWKGFRALSGDPAVSPTLRGFYLGAAAGLAGLLAGGISAGYLTPAADQIFVWLAIGMMYGQRARKTDDVSISRQHAQAGIPTQPA